MSETDEALLTNEARNESVEMVPAAESPVADTVAAIVEEATLVTLPDTMPEAAIEEVKQQQTEESGSEGDVANSETSRVEDSKKEDDESDLYSIRHFSV
jgi:hypothetical protein